MIQRSSHADLRLTPSAKFTLNEADETPADQRRFVLTGTNFDRFLAVLDAPPRRHPRLERLFRDRSVFDAKIGP